MPDQNFSEDYSKSRRQLVLWSTILIVWQWVGFDLESIKEMDGSAGALIKSIEKPDAIPVILTLIILYFLYRYIVEWNQSDEGRTSRRVSRFDFLVVFTITLISVFSYLLPVVLRAVHGELPTPYVSQLFTVATVLGIATGGSLVAVLMGLFLLFESGAKLLTSMNMFRGAAIPKRSRLFLSAAYLIIGLGYTALALFLMSEEFFLPDMYFFDGLVIGFVSSIIYFALVTQILTDRSRFRKWFAQEPQSSIWGQQ